MTACVLVTGATGFIGNYLVRALLRRGSCVRVLARRPDLLPADVVRKLDVIAGDVRDRQVLTQAVNGAGTVLHLAGFARAWCRDRSEYRSVNVDGVRTLLNVTRKARTPRLVHVSTILTLPPHRPAPLSGPAMRPTPYEATKLEGELLVAAYAESGAHAVIVHPTRVFGPGPLTDANGVTRAIALYLGGRLRVRLADRGVQGNYVHAADVAEGIVLAAERGRPGARYILGGENASFEEFLHRVAEIGGVTRRLIPLPPSVALAVAKAAEAWGHLGGAAPITARWVRTFLEDRRADIRETRAALGYSPRSLMTGLTETIRWLRTSAQPRQA